MKYVEGLMREGKVDGVFLDAVGIRPWASLAEWNSWPQSEKNAFAAGNVDLVRRLDARRRAIKPDFIIVSNNVWEAGTMKRARSRALPRWRRDRASEAAESLACQLRCQTRLAISGIGACW